MAGINQTLMLSLSMVVIAALIGAGGLGLTVYVALGRLDIGSAVIGGTGIVILAIILDRITQKFAATKCLSFLNNFLFDATILAFKIIYFYSNIF